MNLRRFNTSEHRVKLLTYSFNSFLCGVIWACLSLVTSIPLITFGAYLFFTGSVILLTAYLLLIVLFSDTPQGKK